MFLTVNESLTVSSRVKRLMENFEIFTFDFGLR